MDPRLWRTTDSWRTPDSGGPPQDTLREAEMDEDAVHQQIFDSPCWLKGELLLFDSNTQEAGRTEMLMLLLHGRHYTEIQQLF